MLETLAALRGQQGNPACEVILADRRNDALSRRIAAAHPEVLLVACPAGSSLPELRTRALERSKGRYVVVTEDHCVPAPDWLESIGQAFARAPAGTVAVGGCVENGVTATPLDWATFLCEYSAFLDPVPEGPTVSLPGMNVAYEGAALRAFDRARLASGFWESTVHPELLQQGRMLYSTPRIRLEHSKKFSFGHFARQRFAYSRHYAARRFPAGQGLRKWATVAATPALPLVLLYRMYREVRARGRLRAEFASALPALSIFVMIWAWGEMAGYALGAGDSLSEIE